MKMRKNTMGCHGLDVNTPKNCEEVVSVTPSPMSIPSPVMYAKMYRTTQPPMTQ